MHDYLRFDEKKISDFSESSVSSHYDAGYVFTRLGKGIMHQTRSIRIDLASFELSSENRRILRKTEAIKIASSELPYSAYDWHIAKMAKDFYDKKFEKGTFSANKVKDLLTDAQSNFNLLLLYAGDSIGYAICYENSDLLHYSYPFYDLNAPPGTGMGMMLRAILLAKEHQKKYIYLGSAQRSGDIYKLQFKGLQWFDEGAWNSDVQKLKDLLRV